MPTGQLDHCTNNEMERNPDGHASIRLRVCNCWLPFLLESYVRQPNPLSLEASMKMPGLFVNALLSLTIVSLSGSLFASRAAAQSADNSAQNKGQLNTADNQSNTKADRETAAQVRKAIVADKDLSTYAHNVKVLVADGTVTLKGPVKSDEEKQKVAADAASVVPADKVANQLTVKQ
jgi:hyperosmotically inducible periplasmic protein